MSITIEPSSSPERVKRLAVRLRRSGRRLTSFGLIGGIAFVVDFAVYNALRATVLSDSPIWSKVVSVSISMVVAWIGNRYLTFRNQRSSNALKEGFLFAVVNLLGLLIATGCLFVSHYLLGFTSQLADNISGNVIGLVLGTAFRFAAYHFVVFRTAPAHPMAEAMPDARPVVLEYEPQGALLSD
ncbi:MULTISPECIES: GtrA family protein [Subtercola]|uniref:GtrA family protein n=1 Tax=Subtercola vilae TaxID=2056433 RepID=A0A4T2C7J6_9MICO|nr:MULTISPECIES: GtrA family protein [Subtercola]MEA9985456.1 GtrA family protein [Subtercola sp. RTI3]TIH39321.1 GtrA family protein [Subtercola vilae]